MIIKTGSICIELERLRKCVFENMMKYLLLICIRFDLSE